MTGKQRNIIYFGFVIVLMLATGIFTSWNSVLFIINFGLISAVMALGVNLQWGFAGLFNVGIIFEVCIN